MQTWFDEIKGWDDPESNPMQDIADWMIKAKEAGILRNNERAKLIVPDALTDEQINANREVVDHVAWLHGLKTPTIIERRDGSIVVDPRRPADMIADIMEYGEKLKAAFPGIPNTFDPCTCRQLTPMIKISQGCPRHAS